VEKEAEFRLRTHFDALVDAGSISGYSDMYLCDPNAVPADPITPYFYGQKTKEEILLEFSDSATVIDEAFQAAYN